MRQEIGTFLEKRMRVTLVTKETTALSWVRKLKRFDTGGGNLLFCSFFEDDIRHRRLYEYLAEAGLTKTQKGMVWETFQTLGHLRIPCSQEVISAHSGDVCEATDEQLAVLTRNLLYESGHFPKDQERVRFLRAMFGPQVQERS